MIDAIVCLLADGDITKRHTILWGFTPDECKPYLKERQRQRLFREVMIASSGYDESQPTEKKAYCDACRAAKLDDCENCDPSTIGKIDG